MIFTDKEEVLAYMITHYASDLESICQKGEKIHGGIRDNEE